MSLLDGETMIAAEIKIRVMTVPLRVPVLGRHLRGTKAGTVVLVARGEVPNTLSWPSFQNDSGLWLTPWVRLPSSGRVNRLVAYRPGCYT